MRRILTLPSLAAATCALALGAMAGPALGATHTLGLSGPSTAIAGQPVAYGVSGNARPARQVLALVLNRHARDSRARHAGLPTQRRKRHPSMVVVLVALLATLAVPGIAASKLINDATVRKRSILGGWGTHDPEGVPR